MGRILEHDEWGELVELAYRAARPLLGEHDAALDTAIWTIERLLDKERRGHALPENVDALAEVIATNLARDRLAARVARRSAEATSQAGGTPSTATRARPAARAVGALTTTARVTRAGRGRPARHSALPARPREGRGAPSRQARLFEPARRSRMPAA